MKFSNLNIGHVNVNSLRNTTNYVMDFICDNRLDIVDIGESWLNSKTPDSYVAIRGFEIFRCDAEGDVNKHGVCLYVSNALKCTVHDPFCPNVIAVHLQDYNILIMMVYRPPSYTTVQNDVLINCLILFCENKEVVVMGDFNLPSLK